MTHPAYGTLRRVTPDASVLLQQNPGHMTLDGTNTWLLGDPAAPVLVDPGEQRDDDHLDRLLDVVPSPALVLLTHHHHDHSGLAAAVHERTGAAVRAVDPDHCHGGDRLAEGEVLDTAGLRLTVLAVPGHTADSAAFVVDGGAERALLTGDTVLGRGTTVVAHPDGDLGDYLASLRRLETFGAVRVLPGHGPELPSLAEVAALYLAHREQRLAQVRAARDDLGPDASARQVVEVVYADVDPVLWDAAELSVRAQLEYLGAGR